MDEDKVGEAEGDVAADAGKQGDGLRPRRNIHVWNIQFAGGPVRAIHGKHQFEGTHAFHFGNTTKKDRILEKIKTPIGFHLSMLIRPMNRSRLATLPSAAKFEGIAVT